MKKSNKAKILSIAAAMLLSGCASVNENAGPAINENSGAAEQITEQTTAFAVAASTDKAEAVEVGYEGMQPVDGDMIKDGEYDIKVDSSSSMFKITACKLKAENGKLSAVMTMSGTGYECLYLGTPEEAAAAEKSDCIPYKEENGVHSFEISVEALDKEIDCAAFSKKKQLWYDRILVFRADSLPLEAFADGAYTTAEDLQLADGEYSVDVSLSGGSGKASVQSPTKLKIEGGKATAQIVWSSNKYDYMLVDGEKYLPVSTDEFSVFEIPVSVFGHNIIVYADTTAMSKPYEIEYTLNFDPSTVK